MMPSSILTEIYLCHACSCHEGPEDRSAWTGYLVRAKWGAPVEVSARAQYRKQVQGGAAAGGGGLAGIAEVPPS